MPLNYVWGLMDYKSSFFFNIEKDSGNPLFIIFVIQKREMINQPLSALSGKCNSQYHIIFIYKIN